VLYSMHLAECGSAWADMVLYSMHLDHETPYSIHPGSTKMYMDLKELFWWNNMKRDIARYEAECHTCQRVKAEHQSLAGL
jgi:hypothetical protein